MRPQRRPDDQVEATLGYYDALQQNQCVDPVVVAHIATKGLTLVKARSDVPGPRTWSVAAFKYYSTSIFPCKTDFKQQSQASSMEERKEKKRSGVYSGMFEDKKEEMEVKNEKEWGG